MHFSLSIAIKPNLFLFFCYTALSLNKIGGLCYILLMSISSTKYWEKSIGLNTSRAYITEWLHLRDACIQFESGLWIHGSMMAYLDIE